MHNGGIADFAKIKRRLQSSLPDEIFNVPQGNTGIACYSMLRRPLPSLTCLIYWLDSEWAFALFLSKVSLFFYSESEKLMLILAATGCQRKVILTTSVKASHARHYSFPE